MTSATRDAAPASSGAYLLWCLVIVALALSGARAMDERGVSARRLPPPAAAAAPLYPSLVDVYRAWKGERVHGCQLVLATGEWAKVDPKRLHELSAPLSYPLQLQLPAEALEQGHLDRESAIYTAMYTGVTRRLFVLLPQGEFSAIAAASREMHNRRETPTTLYTTFTGFPRHLQTLGPLSALDGPAVLLVTASVFRYTTAPELLQYLAACRGQLVRVYACSEEDNPKVDAAARARLREFVDLAAAAGLGAGGAR